MMEELDPRLKWFLIAEVIALIGIVGDVLTTTYALSTGLYYETHIQYTPMNAFLIFTMVNLAMTPLEPTWKWQILRLGVVGLSWYGMVNNLLWLLGFFPL